MYIEIVPNRKSKPTILLRESWREGKKTVKRTLANLTHLPSETIESLRRALKGEKFVPANILLNVTESKQHGHILAVLIAIKKLRISSLIASKQSRNRGLVLAMIVARILNPSSKLAITRWWKDTTLSIEIPEIGDANEDDLYKALDWLIKQKPFIEKKLANRHLSANALVLYDLSSSYVEGKCCQIAKYGYSRDRKKGKKQVNYGLLTDKRGCPIAIDVFEGNVKDSVTLSDQVEKIKTKFDLTEVVIVGDRGMITQGHIDQFKLMKNIDWISALKTQQIKVLFENSEKNKAPKIKNEIDSSKTLFEIKHPDYPGERLIVCKNEQLAKKRDYDRQSLIKKTEEQLTKLQSIIKNKKLFGKDEIGLRVGRDINRYKVAKLFDLRIEDNNFRYSLNQAKLDKEKNLDGIYIIRTSLTKSKMKASNVVLGYKNLCHVERAFRSIKTMDLKIRPIYHYNDERVKAHIFLCMLAYYVEWHMKEAWRPLLFSDEEIQLKESRDPVLPAQPSKSAKKKAKTKKLPDGSMAHSFQSLLMHLSTITRNTCKYDHEGKPEYFETDTNPNKTQKKALDFLLAINVPSAPSHKNP